MSGLLQARSSEYDPAPQFTVHEVESHAAGRWTLTGRCWFEPIEVGTRFTSLVSRDQTDASAEPCDLEVAGIEVFGKPVDWLGQTTSARLTLTGTAELRVGAHEERLLLVAETHADGAWVWDGDLWHLTHATAGEGLGATEEPLYRTWRTKPWYPGAPTSVVLYETDQGWRWATTTSKGGIVDGRLKESDLSPQAARRTMLSNLRDSDGVVPAGEWISTKPGWWQIDVVPLIEPDERAAQRG